MRSLSEGIMAAISASGMTQKEVAERAGITAVSLCRYANGSRIPDAIILSNIAEVCGTTPNVLLGKDVNPPGGMTTAEAKQVLMALADEIAKSRFSIERTEKAIMIAIKTMEENQ